MSTQQQEQHRLRIGTRSGTENWAKYRFTVRGTVERAGSGGEGANPSDAIIDMGNGTYTMIGGVRGGTDVWTFTGEILEFTILEEKGSGASTLELDGSPTSPQELSSGGSQSGGGTGLFGLTQLQALGAAAVIIYIIRRES